MSRLEFNPVISLTLWATLAAAAVALLAWYALAARQRIAPARRWSILGLMGLAIALPLGLLLNPTWIETLPPPAGKPVLTVVVDSSASMATDDAAGPRDSQSPASTAAAAQTRFARASQIATKVAERLGNHYDVRIRTFAGTSRPRSLDELQQLAPQGETTDLTAAINDVLSEERPQGQGILLLSDGVHNAGPTADLRPCAARAKAANTPVYTFTLGGSTGVRDLDLSLAAPQELAFVGQKIPIHVQVRQRGDLTRKSKISLSLDGNKLEEREIDLVPDGQVSAIFEVAQEKVGLYRYAIEIAPHPDEVTQLNNSAALLLRVVDQPVKALLLEGKPYWDTKFLLRTLSQDPSIALSSVIRIADGRLLDRGFAAPETSKPDADAKADDAKPAAAKSGDAKEIAVKPDVAKADAAQPDAAKTDAPATGSPASAIEPRVERWSIAKDAGQFLADRATLSQYQLIILGREADVFLSDEAITQLKKWLADGDGSLICFRGAPSAQLSQRLAGLMPVKWTAAKESRFRVRFTSSGQDLRWLPPGAEGDDPLAALPSLSTVNVAEARQPLATVLAAETSSNQPAETPVIAFQSVGLGKVVVVEGAGMWRWAFLPQQHQRADATYPLLWRSLIRWLTSNAGLLPTQKLALRSDQVSFFQGEPIVATLLVRESELAGEIPSIELSREPDPMDAKHAAPTVGNDPAEAWPRVIAPLPSGEAPGVFRVPLGKLPEGRYQARVKGTGDDPTTRLMFDVRDNLRERLDVAARPDLMKLVGEESGGGVLEHADPEELFSRFQTHLAQTRPDRILRTPAWDRWWSLAAILGVWAAAWSMRRRSGLI